MSWENLKSNSVEGDRLIAEMKKYDADAKNARSAFTDFIINECGFAAWHIHDGWLKDMDGNNGSKVLDYQNCRLTWIHDHDDFSHSYFKPELNDEMVIVKRSPDGSEKEPITLYVCRVTGYYNKGIRARDNDTLELKQIALIYVVYNKEKRVYEPNKLQLKKTDNPFNKVIRDFMKLINL